MPVFGPTGGPPVGLYPGQVGVFFGSAAIPTGPTALQSIGYEAIAPGVKSRTINIAAQPGFYATAGKTATWRIFFSSTPGSCSIILQGSSDAVDANFQTLTTVTNTGTTSNQITAATLGSYQFLRVLQNSSGTVNIYTDIQVL
jgi:hypothetical protein